MDPKPVAIEQETYFLIAKFLEDGPCQEAAKLLPRRTDWLGNSHPRTMDDMESLNHHIQNEHIIKLLSRLGSFVEKVIPTKIENVNSLLTTGNFSLLRARSDSLQPRNSTTEAACFHGCPALPPCISGKSNFVNIVTARSVCGSSRSRNFVSGCNLYSKVSMHKRILGHLASVYCVLFDKTGHVIATGADDNLVKLWSSFDGRLLATLRGHSGEISDLAINQENSLIAAGSCDKTIRVWSLINTAPVAVLQGHTGMITSLQFCPSAHEDARYLMSTGGDGTVCFWKWDIKGNSFESTPVKFNEKSRPGAQMLCSSFSPGGGFLVTGSSDNIIRVYQMMPAPVEKIAELSAHTDHVDSIQFSNSGFRFATGSRDGTARIWQFQRNEWKHIALNAYERLKSAPSFLDEESLKSLKLKVTMVGWNVDDQFLVTAITDHSLKVWDSFSGELIHILVGHSDEVFVLECHPHEPYIYLSAGHDGNVILWDILKGVMIKSFFNLLEGQGHGAIFDSRFAPDGMSFAVSDSHGHLCIFGFGSDEPFKKVPYEQFFHTDYRPLIRDANNFILDEQTQMAPHLMPPPFLVDVDGNPHPPFYQLLIPGRNANNLPTRRVEIPVSDLPPLLAEIAAEEAAATGRQNLLSPERRQRGSRSPLRSPAGGGGGGGVGLRQTGDVEGVRQVDSNVFISQDVSASELALWRNRKIFPSQKFCFKKQNELYRQEKGKEEIEKYTREKKRRPLSTSQRLSKIISQEIEGKSAKKATKGGRGRAAPRQRISYTVPSEMVQQPNYEDDDDEEEGIIDVEQFISSGSDSDWNSDSSDSSEDSDWTAEVGLKKEQRESRRRRLRRVFSSGDEAVDENGTENESEIEIVASEKEDEQSGNEKEAPSKKCTATKKKSSKKAESDAKSIENTEEYMEMYKMPDWLTSMLPQKSPYVPQVGDEVYYFRQGHEIYVKAVLESDLLDINPKKQCYMKYNLKAEELCRVVNVHYNVGPPRTCSLRLALMNPETNTNTGGSFNVKYHDMENVLDFFVLRHHYEQAKARDWQPGDRFRSVIEDRWWWGTIVEKGPFQDDFPESCFNSAVVRWDTGEEERLSPWDMEPVTENDPRAPEDEDRASLTSDIPLTLEDRTLFDYTPSTSDWPDEGRDQAIDRISNGIEQFSELAIAGAFAYPVDVSSYADYLATVPHPTDLNTIRQRLVNKFYRRRNALLWEVRLIEQNAKLYNEDRSEISRNSSLVTKLLIEFICDHNCRDLIAFYNQSMESGVFENEISHEKVPESRRSSSRKSKSSKRKNRSKGEDNTAGSFESTSAGSSSAGQSWISIAGDLLDFLMSREDSDPFRMPVDTDRYPDYTSIVSEPMDLSTVRQQLDNRLYDDAEALVRDVRLVFFNSRLYNTNKRSRIYGMTLRLSALFEDRVQALLSLSSNRKRRKQSNRKSTSFLDNVVECKDSSKALSKTEQSDASQEMHENSLRLVLRRNAVRSESNTSRRRSGNEDVNQASFAVESWPTTETSPRRTGIVLNLRTGQSRELSDECDSNTDLDGVSSKRDSKSAKSQKSDNAVQRKKVRRVVMPREFLTASSRRRPQGSETSVAIDSTCNTSKTEDISGAVEESNHECHVYSTRSGRRIRPKHFGLETDSEKENKQKLENGIRNDPHHRRRMRRRLHSKSSEEDISDEDNVVKNIKRLCHAKKDESDYDEEEDEGENSSRSNVGDSDTNSVENNIEQTEGTNRRTRENGKNKAQNQHSHSYKDSSTRKRNRQTSVSNETNSRKSKRTRLKVNYNEDDENSPVDDVCSDSDDDINIIGVSSRGRVRKAASRYADFVDS
eukprot:gene17794-9472_t